MAFFVHHKFLSYIKLSKITLVPLNHNLKHSYDIKDYLRKRKNEDEERNIFERQPGERGGKKTGC